MTSPAPDTTKDLQDLQTEIRDLERSLKELFSAIYLSKALSRHEGISMIVKSGQQLQELYRQEKALVNLRKIR